MFYTTVPDSSANLWQSMSQWPEERSCTNDQKGGLVVAHILYVNRKKIHVDSHVSTNITGKEKEWRVKSTILIKTQIINFTPAFFQRSNYSDSTTCGRLRCNLTRVLAIIRKLWRGYLTARYSDSISAFKLLQTNRTSSLVNDHRRTQTISFLLLQKT